MTKTWDNTIVDRKADLQEWGNYCYQIKKRGVTIYAYANNHYAGHAPATVRQFLKMWEKLEPARSRHPQPGLTLFE